MRGATLVLVMFSHAAVLAAQTPAARPAGAAPRDAAIAEVVGAALARELWYSIARAAFDTTVRAGDLQFPDAEAPMQWNALRQHLLTATRSRARTPRDSTYWFVRVGEASVTGNTLRVHFTIGGRQLCPDKGSANGEQSFELKATRATGGAWSPPETRITESSHGISCADRLELLGGGA